MMVVSIGLVRRRRRLVQGPGAALPWAARAKTRGVPRVSGSLLSVMLLGSLGLHRILLRRPRSAPLFPLLLAIGAFGAIDATTGLSWRAIVNSIDAARIAASNARDAAAAAAAALGAPCQTALSGDDSVSPPPPLDTSASPTAASLPSRLHHCSFAASTRSFTPLNAPTPYRGEWIR